MCKKILNVNPLQVYSHAGPGAILLTWINLNLSMDK